MLVRANFGGHSVLEEWERFVSGPQENAVMVRTEINDSWKRCAAANVSPYHQGRHRQLEEASIAVWLKRNKDLITIAKPFMANLYQVVAGSGFVVVLTDDRGYIMDLYADKDTLDNPLTLNFFTGADWSEAEAGTNAIGTTLHLRQPVQVSGPEHYCRKHHCLTCSAAPILDRQGRVRAILDVSGASESAHLHTLGMVVAAAEAIMAQMAIQQKNRELVAVNKRLTNIFNTMSDGVITINAEGVISDLNPVARRLLGKSEKALLGVPLERVFGEKSALNQKLLQAGEAYADMELLVDTELGISHCLVSGEPLTDEQGTVSGGVIILRTIEKIQSLVNRFSGHYGSLQFSDIIGNSGGLLEAVRVASLAAASPANVLLQGESGTGKEIFAQAIHNRSDRRLGPFVAVNCGAIPRELIGSELFGYEEGAFTGARRGGKPGKFELASGGTLFLDEIGDMPLEQQVTLLRVLQERKVSRVGSEREIPIDVRIICATNKCLWDETEQGMFRQDLFYRLNVISVNIPPLRERGDDIGMLFQYFLETMDRQHRREFLVAPAVLACLQNYSWPGNVRELQNVAERIVSLVDGRMVEVGHLPAEIRGQRLSPVSRLPNQERLLNDCREERRRRQEVSERQEILNQLHHCGGNVTSAARLLGVSRNTLYRKMRQYAIDE
ncbi:MAG TPA: sigma-54-dependent Fis family transcriptional regulator [Patescibacteria group bacterium]|nr:sigma-54-dependent Fis family transcriptional regulator [Patescibacteria group bacterium]